MINRICVLTISDRASTGEYEDITGPAIVEVLRQWNGFTVEELSVVADDAEQISKVICNWTDNKGIDLIFTNGGTGLTKRDVTPEATLALIDREIPGIAELLRRHGQNSTMMAALSRQVVGQRNNSIIVNLPGSPKGALESISILPEILTHALMQIQGIAHK